MATVLRCRDCGREVLKKEVILGTARGIDESTCVCAGCQSSPVLDRASPPGRSNPWLIFGLLGLVMVILLVVIGFIVALFFDLNVWRWNDSVAEHDQRDPTIVETVSELDREMQEIIRRMEKMEFDPSVPAEEQESEWAALHDEFKSIGVEKMRELFQHMSRLEPGKTERYDRMREEFERTFGER